ncbi:MAG: hypothetical protein R2731_05490 [Nocardioides sp.]
MPMFERYYRAVQRMLEPCTTSEVVDGPAPVVHVDADRAATQVRRIMARLVADETGAR